MLDLAYSMETACVEKEKQDVNLKLQTIYKDIELPVLQPNIDAAHAYLVSTFLSGKPIFGVVSEDPTRSDQAKQMESIIYENSIATGWGRQLSMFFKSGLKYNAGAIDVDWKIRRTFNPITVNEGNTSIARAGTQEIYRGGNELKSLDMYNTFMDTSVPIADVHIKGDYAGYVERLTLVQLHSLVTNLQINGGQVMNINDSLWCSAPSRNLYFIPQVIPIYNISSSTNWLSFLGANSAPLRQGNINNYEVLHYTRRIIPAMMGITNVPDRNSVQIWKFIEVNGYIIYAERKSNAHDQLPVIFVQPNEDNLSYQTKGPAQNLFNFQNLAGTMFRARLASLARAISDRGIYDPARISKKDINSTNPAAKIPVRPGAYGAGLEAAYRPIPYDDRTSQTIYQDIGQVMQWGQDAAHINRSQRGQFTKGNRTLEEYQDVMQNADNSQQVMALLIEDQAMIPLKHQIKVNTLQYQSATQLPDPNTKEVIDINPVDLRKAVIEFKLADGLVPKDKLLGIGPTMEAFQIMSQIPQPPPEDTTTPRYDLIGMLVNTLEARGARLSQFKLPQGQQGAPTQTPPQGPEVPA
jgi:hypothetical protein